jgi:hypothetical protein
MGKNLVALAAGLTALAPLIGCQQAPVHAEISKPGVAFEQARQDLAGCKFEGEKSAGQPPVDQSLLAVQARTARRTRIAALCLESKGYAVRLNLPGSCQVDCVGPTEVRTR